MIIYRSLPVSAKRYILTHPEEHAEYEPVVDTLRVSILSSYQNRLHLSVKNIRLMKVLLEMYYNIKSSPPRTGGRWLFRGVHDINSFDNFSEKYYPFYAEFYYDVDRWPKFMLLIYITYMISYNSWYNIKQGIDREINNIYPQTKILFNRKREKFISYIYRQYKHLDENVPLIVLRFIVMDMTGQ